MSDLIPCLPEDIAIECLTRLHYSTHRVCSRVCKCWRHLLRNRDFYHLRKQTGHTHKLACLVQTIPVRPGLDKPPGPPCFGINIFEPVTQSWHRIDPIPEYPDGLPLFCHVEGSEGKLVVMGGWDPSSYSPVSHVFVYDFVAERWSRGRDMPEFRSFFAVGEYEGKIVIAGGHDESKNALSTSWEYDVVSDTWIELPRMSQERDECEGVVMGSEFWVVSGYVTERQGEFGASAEVYGFGSGEWRRIESVWWKAGEGPRRCLGVTEEGTIFEWGVGTCAVQLGGSTFLSRSAQQGEKQEFFVAQGQDGKLSKLDVAEEFAGDVQCGCTLEI